MRNHCGERVASVRIAGVELAIRTRDWDRRVSVALACAVAGVGMLLAPSVGEAETVNGSVRVIGEDGGVRSISLSTQSVALSTCYDDEGTPTTGLTFPGAFCFSPAVTVTYHNSQGFPGHVYVSGGDATGDAGGTWTLSSDSTAGADEYSAGIFRLGKFTTLTSDPSCNTSWGSLVPTDPCAAGDQDSRDHELVVFGPESTSHADSTWTIPYVFTAVA